MSGDRDDAVAAHYAAYPYPARDPADEKRRLIEGSPGRLPEIEHYLFQGRAPRPFRALIAGGGSGDAAVMLSQHMTDRGLDGEVVYLDLSEAARGVAEARAAARGLANIRFVTGSLLDARDLVGDGFDYVDCCGVLHHLDTPEAGLAALRSVLSDDGGMGVMVYGAHGRRGVYDMQAMADLLAPHDLAPAERLAAGKRLFAELPASNWLKRNPFVRDHLDGGDAGFYDLLLHARDRAYDVPGFDALVRSAGLAVVSYIEPALYEPETYLKDRNLLARAAAASPVERAALAENLAGVMSKHTAYLAPTARAATAAAVPNSPEFVPVLRDVSGPKLAEAARAGRLTSEHMGIKLIRPTPRLAPAILRRIDGEANLGAIHGDIQAADSGLTWEKFQAAFEDLFHALAGLNMIWLRR